MILAKLSIRYDRGTGQNTAQDLGVETIPQETPDGKIIRGAGSHYRSKEAKEQAAKRSVAEKALRKEFRKAFMAAPVFQGAFVLPHKGAGEALLETLEVPPDVIVSVIEAELTLSQQQLPPVEITEWAERVQKQLKDVPLGKETNGMADTQGLGILAKLADCPVLADETRNEIKQLIAQAKLEQVSRVSLRRKLVELDVKIEGQPVAPRRAPVVQEGDLAPEGTFEVAMRRARLKVGLPAEGVA